MASWFATVTNEKISQINEEAAPDNTKKVTKVDLAVFTAFGDADFNKGIGGLASSAGKQLRVRP
ncbi:unnamed protein product, partial [Porites evermanni]